MNETFDVILLLALPASGKSEVRRYLANMSAAELKRDFHIGDTIQLDDFPYVHMMRRVDDELVKLGKARMFFKSPDRPFADPKDWGTLIHLINEDYADLLAKRVSEAPSAAALLVKRVENAAGKAGISPRLSALDAGTITIITAALEKEARSMLDEKHAAYPASFEGKTIIIEAARGGAHGSAMPLAAPFGYRYSLGEFAPEIIKKAVILYVWVTPEESRRKNTARTDPNDPGSILHHGVPMEVMMNDYGTDDMDWLEKNSEVPGTVTISAGGVNYHLPIGRFDNRVDKTSFLRDEKADWPAEKVKNVRLGIKAATDKMYALRTAAGK
ncbi:MAG: hypothetical protein A2021_00605 [Elusimicrobia bacterium GWF2_52_66]|nr:MAG: hypothetical protein A2X33_06240 [Elusimicrobia bacterium GWA2_51_34]OGR85228.1 MAG: hypothetical protein A2021_00605 [Elusimicrobia bacterium GWF2_52_66]HAF94732.1 hypothetical protein [Elusimicrobiota bacterium]HCE97658.1 hypothetical protein [Elusimicrobiota bacterium]